MSGFRGRAGTILENAQIVIDNYLVCYIVDPDKVTVTDVLYGASNVHARLKARHKADPDI